jgi:DNA-binding protein HU-beta
MFVGYDTMNLVAAFIAQEVALGHKVNLRGVGTISATERPARKGTHPRTGEAIDIPAGRRVRFTPSQALKTAINSNGADHA